jgi:hypothetical protein
LAGKEYGRSKGNVAPVGKVVDDCVTLLLLLLPATQVELTLITGNTREKGRGEQRLVAWLYTLIYVFRVMSVAGTLLAEGGTCSFALSHIVGINPRHRKYAGGFYCTVSVLFCMTEK